MCWEATCDIVCMFYSVILLIPYMKVIQLALLFFLWVFSRSLFWRRRWHPTPVLLPGKSHGRRSLVGCSPWGHEESEMAEWLHFHFSLSCIGEGNGNPLQCSCLENPRDGGAWWAAVYGVAQSQTWLKWLSSNSSRNLFIFTAIKILSPFFSWRIFVLFLLFCYYK